jgi:hypothetical protein
MWWCGGITVLYCRPGMGIGRFYDLENGAGVFIHNAIGWMVEVGTSSKREKCGSHSTRAVEVGCQ